ncbi:MAG TPA: MFS transporter [Elusimicrobia bacterium]|nr:MAG: MFS transporter [Elusimicrobia bacterium GWA2_64_40]OGR66477.1 MAG: MFS transporter [Elusimicrobia bacterium GWB2_63_16]HAN03696.1 MFS transporter [Elusimicrobiota bacterium]HAU90418.1 MFS transporter [Elusimicrobiota bacterium]
MTPRGSLELLLRAFKYRNYRLFFGGQCLSLIGTWMQSVALSWLVYRLTGSPLLLGVTGFASQAPSLLLAPFTGPAADRFDRRKILLVTQVLSMVQALALAALVLFGDPRPWQIIALAALSGVINAFDMPARQSFIVQLVERREDLANAIALNSSMFNSARLIGPSIAGICIAAFGEGVCFLFNGLSYIAVIAALLAMRLGPAAGAARASGGFQDGLRYVFGFPPIKYIILMLAVGSLLGMPYAVLMPAYVREILHGGPRTLGFIMAASGVGALAGSLRLALRRHPAGLEREIPLFTSVFGLGLLAFAFSTNFALSALLIALASYGMVSFFASSNTVIQTLVDDDKRGRVMALHSVAFMGMAPLGSLLAGAAAERIGVAYTMALSGLCVLAATAAFASRRAEITAHAAPVYSRLGMGGIAAGEVEAAEAERPV